MKKKVTIKIPEQLYDSLKKLINNTGFSSVTEFIVYVMRDISSSGRIDQKTILSKEEIKSIKKRLRMLGYID